MHSRQALAESASPTSEGRETIDEPIPERARPDDLSAALHALRQVVGAARFPLHLPGMPAVKRKAGALAAQLDDYLTPRVRDLDATLLAVVGGSTGVGKSTLVNSVVRAPVSPAGALRPTTRSAVVVCHPSDEAGLAQRDLPVQRIATAPLLAPGLALVDAPDLDSVVAANRKLAEELLAAADLWLFVTTAARYADAVPWGALHDARDRGTVVAIVLDRVPAPARDDVTADFARLLRERHLADAPLFVINESTRDSQGLLGDGEVEPVRAFVTDIAASASSRRSVTLRTLLGAVAAAADRADELAAAATEQAQTAARLGRVARLAYARAVSTVEDRIGDGLRGQVYAQWRELVDGGDADEAVRIARDSSRARLDKAPPGGELLTSLCAALTTVLVQADRDAAEDIDRTWRADPAGRRLLRAGARAVKPARTGVVVEARPSAVASAQDMVQGWQSWLRAAARAQAPRVRTAHRGRGTAAIVLLATIAALTPPEAPAGTAGAAVLARVRANPAAADLGERARAELLARTRDLFAARARGRLAEIESWDVDASLAQRLREAGEQVRIARQLSLVLAA